MKRIAVLMLLLGLLCGCTSAAQPSESTSATAVTLPTTATQAITQPSTTQTTQTEPAVTEPADPALQILQNLNNEEKVGQLFLARYPSLNAIQDIEKYRLGGYILFASDFKFQTPDGIRQILNACQNASAVPMLIAVDEEGGIVNRVSCFPAFRSEPFPSSRTLYAAGGLPLIESNETEKCRLLRSLGINVNVAPVCDVTTDPKAFMYSRSLGQSPQITGGFVASVVKVMQENCVGGILKHFPGYGNNTDTHVAVAVDERPLSQLESNDLVPFSYGIKAGAQAIMVSHVYINAIDPAMPATLSPAVHAYLRDTMGFTGVIVTDDLVMKAITDVYGVGESAVLAVLAGNDLLCVTDYAVQYEAVLQAVNSGRISQEILDTAVVRILRWKMQLQLIS